MISKAFLEKSKYLRSLCKVQKQTIFIKVIKSLFKFSPSNAKQYGQALSDAFSHCMTAGAKAVTGKKLLKEVLAVHKASLKAEGTLALKRELVPCKGEQQVGKRSADVAVSPERPRKALKPCLSW